MTLCISDKIDEVFSTICYRYINNSNGSSKSSPEPSIRRLCNNPGSPKRHHRALNLKRSASFRQGILLYQPISLSAGIRKLLQKASREARTHPLPGTNQHQALKHLLLHFL